LRTLREISVMLGVSLSAIRYWMARDSIFKQQCDSMQTLAAQEVIGTGLQRLALGAVEVTNTEEWIDDSNPDRIIKMKQSTKHLPPSVMALTRLANRYAPNQYNDAVHEDITIRITQRNRSLSIAERLLVLQSDTSSEAKDIKDIESIECNYKELETPLDGFDSDDSDSQPHQDFAKSPTKST